MLKELEGYSWAEVFNHAGRLESDCLSDGNAAPGCALPNDLDTPVTPFSREDVVRLVGLAEGEDIGDDWLACGELRDGRWFFVAAGCNCTGWRSQHWGRAAVAATLEEVLRFGMSPSERARLGLTELLEAEERALMGSADLGARASRRSADEAADMAVYSDWLEDRGRDREADAVRAILGMGRS